jgi:L-amino acid N-acyltransferase YncA
MEYAIERMKSSDWDAVRAIYLDGIATRNATFEIAAPEWEQWDHAHLPYGRLVVRASDGTLFAWAALSPVSRRECYSGVAELSIYVAADRVRQGIGKSLLAALIEVAESEGVWTLQAGIFPENAASVNLVKKAGFREVGRRERIARLDGRWRDVLLFERRSTIAGVKGQRM